MSLSNRSVSNSPTASILLKAKRFGIFSIFMLTAIIANPLLAKAQIAVDGSTATEVKGNAIAPVGQGTVNGGNLYHSFDKFNVPNSGVIFNTGNSSVDGTKVNNIINRVTGDTPSSILGTIESRSAFPNANLYLLNPNGVVFGANARLDIGGSFNVTTGTSLGFDQNQKFSVDKNSLSFPTGDPKNIQFAIAQPAAIINQGNLNVDAGKNISLTAGTVINTGNLTAPNGNINLAAVSGNSQVELRSPDLVLGFAVNKDVIPSNWNGAIATLPKLAELLTGQASQANQVVVKPDGTIALVASPSTSDIAVKDGMNITSGKIDVSSATSKGGNVGVFGNQVGLVNSLIDASGINGGGTVLIGGTFQGKGIAPNALQTYVDASSKILANGLLVGDGGKVIVWADRSTQFFGAIAAKGGDVSGDGGFVEVSGKENLDYRGSTNTLAPNGKIGTLLLDPDDIVIALTAGSSTLANASAFNNVSPANALLDVTTVNSAATNVVLQAKNNITFADAINIATSGVGITAQAGNSILVGNAITTNGGNVSLTANDPAFATNGGNISIFSSINTQGGAIDVNINDAGQLFIAFGANLTSGNGNITLESKGTNSRIFNQGNITTATGAILLDASSTSLAAINLGAASKIESDSGSITITGSSVNADGFFSGINDVTIKSSSGNINIDGTSVNGNGIFGTDNLAITSSTGNINLTGISTGGTGGNGVLFQTGNVIQVSTTSSNINIAGNAVNPASLGVNIQPPIPGGDIIIDSGTGNLTFTSDRSIFPNLKFSGSGTLTLQPFTTTAGLDINGSATNTSGSIANVFLDSSFLTTLALSNNFNNVVIGNVSSNNAMSLVNPLSINSNTAPISILTDRTFNANSNAITTNRGNLTLTANQGITNLGNITTTGGNVTISSTTGNISSTISTSINTSSTDSDGGVISITANNGSLSLQNLDSSTTNGATDSNAGNITLTVAGDNNISVAEVFASRNSLSNNGNGGNLSFAMGIGNITLTGGRIFLFANVGKGGSVTFPNPVILAGTPLINSFNVNTRGTTSGGNVIFEDTLTSPSPTGSRLSVLTSSGNITFNSTVGLSTAPLAQFLLDSDNTITFANTVFASSITSNQGLTVINGNIVATGTFVPSVINLGNFTLNGDISLVGDEINLIGTGTNTALGNITLKPFTTNRPIAIGGINDEDSGTLNLLTTDISKFGAGGSLTIGHESGTGDIFFLDSTTFNRPTTLRSPVGAGNVTINNNITATGSLTVQAGNAIAIANNAQITSSSGALSLVLNSDRDADNSGKISIDTGSLINSNGGDIVLGGGANPLTTPAVFNSFANHGATINGSLNAAGGNITINGSNVFTGSGSNVGVHISSAAQVTTNGNGNITITGSGGNGGSNNHGVEILTTGTVVETANGNITITGIGNGTTSANNGIFITNEALIRTTGAGNLILSGTSNSSGNTSSGIVISRGILEAISTGNITLTGNSGTGAGSVGVSLNSSSTTNPALIRTAEGSISIAGTSNAITGDNNQGVLLGGNATIFAANNNANLTITGTGGLGVNNNQGIRVDLATSAITLGSLGNLSLTGTGRGTGTGNHGIFVSSGKVDALGTGSITFTGFAPANSFGILLSNANIKPTNTSGLLRFSADEIDSNGLNNIRGSGLLFIEPATATRNIILGGASNASDTNLEINDTLLAGLQTGFTQVFIGRTDSSGLISLGNNIVFNNPVTLRSPLTTGAINTSGFNFRNITGNVTFLANQNITAGNIIASGNATSLTSTTGGIDTSSGTIDTSTDGNGGNISFSAATGSTVGSLNTASKVTGNAGAIAFSNGNITITGSDINTSSVSGTAANLNFAFPVILNTSTLTINTASTSGTSGNVTFTGNLNGTTANTNNLVIDAEGGALNFNGAIGNNIPLGNITLTTSGTTTFNSVNASNLTTINGGTALLLGNVTSLGNQEYNGAVFSAPNITLNSSSGNGNITFNGVIANNVTGTPSNLTLNAGTGNIQINKGAGSSGDRFGDITVTNAGNFNTGAGESIFANSFTQLAGTGTTSFDGNPDDFTGNLTVVTNNFSLNEGATLQAGNINITALGNTTSLNGFSGSSASRLQVTGAGNITINADSDNDGIGTFLSRGLITDGGLGRDVNIRAAQLDITGNVTAAQIFLTPSTNAPTIAIGSTATGIFRLEDTTISFLNATNLVSIAANNGNVNIGNTQAFNTGTSLEIGTTASPANIITSATGSTLTVDKNLSTTGKEINLGNTTVGGDLTMTGDTVILGNTKVGNATAGNLTIRITKEVSQTGTVTVGGQTNFIVDTNPLTNILLADFANNFGSAITLTFDKLSTKSFNNLEFRTVNVGAQFNVAPERINNLKLILDNGTIALSSIPLTGSLTLSAKDVSTNGNIIATTANLSGGNVTINNNLTTTAGDLAIINTGLLTIKSGVKLDLQGALVQSGTGAVQLGGNIGNSTSVSFAQPITLIGNSIINSTGNVTFNSPVNGANSLTIDANGNFVILNAAIGSITPLDSVAIASSTTLKSEVSTERVIIVNPIQISTTGNITLGAISNLGADVTLSSSAGTISTGDITTTGQIGGRIFIDASQAINVGILNSSGSTRAGDVTLDPVGDVVVRAIDASSSTQGGNVTLVSTGGNLRITDTLLSSTTSDCVGASICTSGGTGGNITLQTGGLNPFLVDDATLNGSKGVLTTGITTVNLGTSIPVIFSSSFIQGGIKVTPGGIITPTPTPTPTDSKQPFVQPETTPDSVSTDVAPDGSQSPIPIPPDILKKEAGNYLQQGNLPKAFDALERSYASELQIFTGQPLNLASTTIDESQEILAKVAQQTGDVAALVYPVLLNNRIEIMVVPPKDRGKPFRQFTVVPSQEAVESVLTDYRNNIRDVGSNDYIEQSQKLYDWIMRPIDSQLKAMKINTLVFVMDAGLRVVPPAAMHDGKQFVVERYGIASVASMRVTRIEERDRKSTRVLAMGLTDSVSGFSALPSVDVEIKTIASNVLEGTSFLNKDFTVDNLQAQRQLGKYSILHLGTHAKFVSDNSQESFIQFWDSRLSLSQIPKLRFDKPAIDMLTLSACQTAVGNNLGISGLAVESGARSVLASLWEVSDAGTAPLMISFYKSFPNAINKAQAMQQAQVSLLSGKVNIKNGEITGILGFPNITLPTGASEIDLSHPFYWSSFILVGNWL